MAKRVKIPGRLESAETGNIVTGADAVMDDEKGKTQVVINSEVDAAIINLAHGKQDNLTFDSAPTEDSPNPVTSAGVYTADKVLSDAIEAILLLIPSAASALNKLVDMQTMNSSIATATASFKGTYNLVSDLHLGVDATHEQISAALDALSLGADNNDYAFVQVPNSATAPTEISKTERFKYNGTNWLFEYDLNNSGFTQGQWNAINSGVTSLLVGKLSDLPTNAELTTLLTGKQDNLTFDNVPTAGSPNPVKSGGVYARNNEIVALINALDAAKQDVLTFDNAPVEGSPNPVKSGGVYTAISAVQAAIVALDAEKQNVLTFDSTPKLGSANPVMSSGIKTELNRIDGNIMTLNDLYEALTQSALVIVQPSDTWPVASPATKTIYRVVDRSNTPPQYYSDYMWNGTAMVMMAQYDNAIDDVPTAGSNNLVKSGGVSRFLEDRFYNLDNLVAEVVQKNKSFSSVAGQSANPSIKINANAGCDFKIHIDGNYSGRVLLGITYIDGSVNQEYVTGNNIIEIVSTKAVSLVWAYITYTDTTTFDGVLIVEYTPSGKTVKTINDASKRSILNSKLSRSSSNYLPCEFNIDQGINYDTGEIVSFSHTIVSDYIKIPKGSQQYTLTKRDDSQRGICFYDDDLNKIKPSGESKYCTSTGNGTFDIPPGASYMRVATYELSVTGFPGVGILFDSTGIYDTYNGIVLRDDDIWAVKNPINPVKVSGDGTKESHYTSSDGTGGISYAISLLKQGGKVRIPSATFDVSNPIVINKKCIKIEGDSWNYPNDPNGVYESNEGSKLNVSAGNNGIQINGASGATISDIGFSGQFKDGQVKGTFNINNPIKDAGLVSLSGRNDQMLISRVSSQGMSAGFCIVPNGSIDACMFEHLNADGCNIAFFFSPKNNYYTTIKESIFSDCPAFGVCVKKNTMSGAYESQMLTVDGIVCVRNGGGFTPEQLEQFGEDMAASMLIADVIQSRIINNQIDDCGSYWDTTLYSTVGRLIEYADSYDIIKDDGTVYATKDYIYDCNGLVFKGVNSLIANNRVGGCRGGFALKVLGNNNNIIGNIFRGSKGFSIVGDGNKFNDNRVNGNSVVSGNNNVVSNITFDSGSLTVVSGNNNKIVFCNTSNGSYPNIIISSGVTNTRIIGIPEQYITDNGTGTIIG